MSRAEETRAKIVAEAANLFNQQGFAGASLADIMAATGLKKGGIYNHFRSKDELALAAFDYAIAKVKRRYLSAMQGKRHAIARLLAIVETGTSFLDEAPIAGGCPLLNTAVESDDTHPLLRDRARAAMNEWQVMVKGIVISGIERRELCPKIDPEEVATVLIATLEGSMMLSQLYRDSAYVERAAAYLNRYIESLGAANS